MARNILLLIADDLGRMAGCYGEKQVATPNIDALARSGTRFDMAFTSTASCSASRSVIYSGLHTHQNGQYGLHHNHHHFMTFAQVETAPKLFGELGYLTGIIGKVHVGPDAVYPWEVREESATRDVRWAADRAAKFFARAKSADRPFFLTIGYVDPHRDLTRSGFGNEITYPGVRDDPVAAADVSVPPFLSDLPGVRQELTEYYRSVSRLDQGIAMALGALSEAGLDDDTLVCFLSDNGAPFLNSKTTLYDAGVHLPLIVRRPGQKRGVANPNLVSFIDILPSFLNWAGDEKSPGLRQGRSFLPILEDEILHPDWRLVFGSHSFHEITNYYPTRFLRTPRYKYHRNVAWKLDFPFSSDLYGSLSWEAMRNQKPVTIGQRPLKNYIRRPPEELYDLDADPGEVVNLALDREFEHLVLQMRCQVEDWQRATQDPWLFRDGVSARAVEHHVKAGLRVPDRFDFEYEEPGNDESTDT
ncbi:MAG: sulfatase, partial [Alphaproteobacteria bacterium]|nr:sulfatase [Alphaproteobacteria bacterium]